MSLALTLDSLYVLLMFTVVPFDVTLTAELRERELQLERTRTERVARAQQLLNAEPRTIFVLQPFIDLEGNQRYWKVPRTR